MWLLSLIRCAREGAVQLSVFPGVDEQPVVYSVYGRDQQREAEVRRPAELLLECGAVSHAG